MQADRNAAISGGGFLGNRSGLPTGKLSRTVAVNIRCVAGLMTCSASRYLHQ